MKVTKRQLRQIIREERTRFLLEQESEEIDQKPNHVDHGWPRVEWGNAEELVDKWRDMELGAFDPGDPSMNKNGELTDAEAKLWWTDQVENASMELENVLVERLRTTALSTMQEITDRLIDGEFA